MPQLRLHQSSALARLEKLVEVNRRQATTALATDLAVLDDQQRNQLRTLSVALRRLGACQKDADDVNCLAALREAMALCKRLGLRREGAIVAFNLGQAYSSVTGLCDLEAAEAAIRESLDLRDENDRVGRARCYVELGRVACGRLEEFTVGRLADSVKLDMQLNAALDGYQSALALLPEDAHHDRAVAHNEIGRILDLTGNPEPAANHYVLSIRHEEARGNSYGAAQTRWYLAALYRTAERFDDALDYARAARDGFASCDGSASWAAKMVELSDRLIARIQRRDSTP